MLKKLLTFLVAIASVAALAYVFKMALISDNTHHHTQKTANTTQADGNADSAADDTTEYRVPLDKIERAPKPVKDTTAVADTTADVYTVPVTEPYYDLWPQVTENPVTAPPETFETIPTVTVPEDTTHVTIAPYPIETAPVVTRPADTTAVVIPPVTSTPADTSIEETTGPAPERPPEETTGPAPETLPPEDTYYDEPYYETTTEEPTMPPELMWPTETEEITEPEPFITEIEPDPPITEPPVTEPPVTEPPVTEPPVTEPPVTEPPVTEPPVTEPPVTEPPVTEPPVTEPPVTEPPVTEPPTTDASPAESDTPSAE